jgi:molybdopterin/thiamine biosynthesis adenylyltransferase
MKERQARQSFLGPNSAELLGDATVAIVGLGGGGSHVAQQLAHVGVGRVLLFDPDRIESSNLNRLVGGTAADVHSRTQKVEIARRVFLGINPVAEVYAHDVQWQLAAEALREADVVVSCVDSYASRQDLEVSARRFLMPLVDVGMDLHLVNEEAHMTGQVIASLPGGPCLRCLGFLTDENLRHEAELYGAAGGRPQVVWANGVLASVAVGLVVRLLTGWQCPRLRAEYLHFDANENILTRSPRVEYAPSSCEHFAIDFVGEPTF